MKTILLDTNAFDNLAEDARARALLLQLRERGHVRLIVPVTVQDELAKSPHYDLLDALRIDVVGNATPVAGIMRAGDFLGDANHYHRHKGSSGKTSDALVAAAAEFHADWLVSDDRRLAHRQKALSPSVETLTYTAFLEALDGIS